MNAPAGLPPERADFLCFTDSAPTPRKPHASVPTVTTGPSPRLTDYDVILVNTSAGKDPQASLDVVAEHARATGVSHRVVVVHADLGDVEWEGVPELAAERAAHYGFRFEVVRRDETILDRVAQRGRFPDAARRWCTSDFKRGPIRTVKTRLVAEVRASGHVTDRPVHLLNVMDCAPRNRLPAPDSFPTHPTLPLATASAVSTSGIRSTNGL